ncbi:MAG: SsrA-binding protein SmpB [Deltaproteobacteria bacterium]|nr:SsrA-binding protein SmpB [Deltaproteobacteria bacterium]MBW1927641.1 SsrA-binding protein SmpB [Deltaproteobacteria bacterium]MBW2025594.1 SsrA-binding protein SmpB [Deltaproteobacteria bacterium]MBW2126188.1 SsrA-binding protein SmpB [Deltaproteobacteria bacterium]
MGLRVICQNRKASHDYHIEEVIEAGIALLGPEVKSLREGRASLVDSYAKIKRGEVFLYNMHITPYAHAGHVSLDPRRPRKLLLKKREIKRLIGKTEEKGFTLIPTKLYFSPKGWVKVELALAKGKRKYDKRKALKEKELKREMEQVKKRGPY